MWLKVAKCGELWFSYIHHIAPLGAMQRNVAHIYEPQFATLSQIQPHNMWRQVAPHWTTFSNFEPCGAIMTNECVPQYRIIYPYRFKMSMRFEKKS